MASILSVTITLVIVAVSVLIAVNVNYSTKNIENEMNIIVYLLATASDQEVEDVESEIRNIKNVRKIEYISKEQQKANMSEYDDAFKTILDYIGDNPLLDSYIVYVKNIEEISDVANKIKDIPNVETVKYGEGMVEEIVDAFDVIEKVTIGLVVALILVTIFLINYLFKKKCNRNNAFSWSK